MAWTTRNPAAALRMGCALPEIVHECGEVIFPIGVETLAHRRPWANWVVIALVVGIALLVEGAPAPNLSWQLPLNFVLSLGYEAHFGLALASVGLLWVFGDGLCRRVGTVLYLLTVIFSGVASTVAHALMGASGSVGMLGAAHGCVGALVALYPKNELRLMSVSVRDVDTCDLPLWAAGVLWWMILLVLGGMEVGALPWWQWAAGMLCGFACALLWCRMGLVEKVRDENPTLWEMLVCGSGEDRR